MAVAGLGAAGCPQREPAGPSLEVAAEGEVVFRRWQTDHWFTCPAEYIARSMAAVSSDARLYLFTRRLAAASGEPLGAFHGAEVAYVFDNLAAENWVPRQAADRELADAMAGYWVQFAATGDPNRDGLPPWPSFGAGRGDYLELGEEIAAGSGLRQEACALWERRLAGQLGLR